MDEKTHQAYKEAFTLKEAGNKWSTVIEKLKESGYLNSKGQSFAESTLRKEYSTLKKDPEKWQSIMGEDLSSEQAECSEYNECSECYERSDHSDRSEQVESFEQSEYWEERVRQIAQEVCQAMIQNVMTNRNVPHGANVQSDTEAPPKPVSKGRKQNRIYGKLGATTDAILLERFNREAKDRGISTGRLMDIVLWERYSKPVLSYEMPEGAELEALRKKYGKQKDDEQT
jgi:hypothetical protein